MDHDHLEDASACHLPPDDSPSPMDESPSKTRRSKTISPKVSAESVPREAKLFPNPTPLLHRSSYGRCTAFRWMSRTPFSVITNLISRRKRRSRSPQKPLEYSPVSLRCDLRQIGYFLRLLRVPSPIKLTATI